MIDRTWMLNEWKRLLSSGPATVNREVETDSRFRCVFGQRDGRPLLFVVASERPPLPDLGAAIDASVKLRDDGQWTLAFHLVQPSLTNVFLDLGCQLAEAVVTATDNRELGHNVSRIIDQWRLLLAGPAGLISDEALRGLVAELWVLDHVVLPEFADPGEAISTWVGPEGAAKDFQFKNEWAGEVKAAGPQANKIQINGVGQLDPSGLERLSVHVITAELSPDGWNLDQVVRHVESALDPLSQHELRMRLSKVAPGWSRREYAQRKVAVRRHREFLVDQQFPFIDPEVIPPGVTQLTYHVTLNGLVSVNDRAIKGDAQWSR